MPEQTHIHERHDLSYPTKVFTTTHPEEVVLAAQVLGARNTGQSFFPRWMVNQYAEQKKIVVRSEKNVYRVTYFRDDGTTDTETVLSKKSKKEATPALPA